ncbi:hypothetical protein D4764_02G0004070 [Takifugu flavidus]|uniref:Reverse transcriptase domain-containing protein n=1 Tax=Takifugu flavidus TaxID=433684 RepID=A0A5C6NJS0_9TELE|nr:hypothetical protein D4764_02G0004070 [Takifugu flavidus]
MLAGKAYMERHNQVAGIVYRKFCTKYGLEVPGSRWETPPKVVENKQAKILWDFQIQTDKMMVTNQPDIVMVDKHQKTVVVIDVAIPSDSNIRKKEHEKLEKYQGLKEEIERMWGMKATVVLVVIGTLGAVTPNLSKWLQQIPGTTSEISVQKSAVLGTAKILRRTLRLPGVCQIITKSGDGYQFRSGTTISHLLYMDDIKLYAKNEHDIDSLIHLTRIYNKDIGMAFRLDKCGRMISRRGKVFATDGVELPERNITDVQHSYKYLGIPQTNGNHEDATRRSATVKNLQRLRQVLKCQLNGKNKIQAINTYALPEETTSLREYIKKMALTDQLLSE